MPRTIAYRAGGFTNCGIGYTKFSQEELAEMKDRVMTENEELKPCPFCGHSIDVEKDVYEPSMDWHPTFIDPDSGGDPINIHCKCGLEFCTGTYDWGEFVEAWNRRANEIVKGGGADE